ncbi:MAG TPA: glycosyltransferase [Thermoanaerobaculia bacterium]|nr:glycosyltransferase [Thermoanaerobaculia bacterium]
MTQAPYAPRPLSVVVPSRNTRQLTLACLAALAAAAAARPELAAVEVVLVDDAGDDGTAEAVAAHYPDVRLVRLERQAGFTRAANRGLAAAAGGVLLLLNSDAEVGADGRGLAALLARFAAEPRLGIAGAALRYPDGTPQWSGGAEPTAAWLFALASGLPGLLARMPFYRRLRPPSGTRAATAASVADVAWVTGAAMAIRRAAWEDAGPLDEAFRFYAQDLDLCLRARQAGWTVAVVPEFEVIHHHGATIAEEGGRRGGAGGGGGPGGGPGGDRRGRGAVHPELLWTDLLRWAEKRGGAAAARRAARALLAGGRVRLLGRRLAAPLVPAAARDSYHADSAAFGRALAAVAAMRAARW